MKNENSEINELFNKAIQNHKNNKLNEAFKLYQIILNKNPNHFESNFYLGTLFAQGNNLIKASEFYKKAIEINKNVPDLHSNLGLVLLQLGEIQNAELSIKKAIQINPNFAMGYNNLGLVNQKLGKYEEAKNFFKKSIELEPNIVDPYNNLGLFYYSASNYEEAKKYFLKILEINKNFIPAYLNLGNIYKKIGEIEKSQNYYEQIIKINPNYFEAYNNLMDLFEKTNQNKKLEKIISEANIKFANNLVVQLFYGKYLYNEEKYSNAISVLEGIKFPENQLHREGSKCLILAKSYEKTGNYEQAFEYFRITNNINSSNKNKNINKNNTFKTIEDRFNFLKEINNTKWISPNIEDSIEKPIFMIGFPRSGTTLLDTILRSHPSIDVIEEKPLVKNLIIEMRKLTKNNIQNLKNIKNQEIQELRKNYFEHRNKYINNINNCEIIIDKMPLNIIHIAEIVRVFPDAKFIVSLRHPYDCVLSCYMQSFKLNDAMSNFLNLKDTSNLYNQVMDLWTKYVEIFDLKYHEIKYEDIVSDFDASIKKILSFLDLDWSDAVLDFYKTAEKRKLISTPSYDQVNKPIYSKSVFKWKNYEKNLSEIIPSLKPWLTRFKY